MDSEFDFEGAGDRKEFRSPGSDTTPYIKRRFANGLPIPVFPTRAANQRSEDLQGAHVPPDASPSMVNVLKEYLCCPVCKDFCVETTAANCGHKFCRQCLDQLRRQKPICPICSSFIKTQHRLYSDDLFVESQLPYLSSEFRRRFEHARMVRMEKLRKDNSSMMKSVRRKLDNSLVYLKCKSSFSLANKIRSTSNSVIGKLYEWNSSAWDRKLFIGIVLGMLITMIYFGLLKGIVNFSQFTWLAYKNFNGTIPEEWMKQAIHQEDVGSPLQFPSPARILQKAIEKIDVIWTPLFFLFER